MESGEVCWIVSIDKDPAKWNFRHSGCVVIRFADGRIQYVGGWPHTICWRMAAYNMLADGRIQYVVGVRFIEPDITDLISQVPT